MNDKDHNESSVVTVSEVQPDRPKRGAYFWLSFLAICVSLFMSAIETSGTSTALPTIINELHGDDFVWVGSAYPLAATALLPASGGMAQVFGRRITMLVALALFALGSALCGCAKNMSWLIAARTIQGAGGGALQSLAGIIVSDLVSLEERGTYNSLIGLTWAVAAGIGPLIGGSLAAKGHWRWFFYINLPTSGLAAILVFSFLRLKTPPGSLKEKLGRMDWIGNIIFIGSATSTAIALTWGGITHPWTSAATLVPLIIGLCGLVFFLAYEEIFAIHPIVPFKLLSNRTSLSGYLQTFFTPIVMIATLYYFATYEQSVKGASAIRSGVCFLSMTLVLGVTMIFTGVSITITKVYRVQLWAGWAILMIAMGAFSTITATTEGWHAILFSGLVGLGCGLLYSAQYFPVLAPLPISENAHALALFSFFRTFASVWAITIGGTILQNQLVKRLPEAFTSQFSSGAALAYASIPAIASLEEPLRSEVRNAFAESIRVIWQVLIGIAAMGMLSSLMMKALPLHTQVDERWGIEEDVNQSQGSTDLGDAELAKKTSLTKDPESIIPQLD